MLNGIFHHVYVSIKYVCIYIYTLKNYVKLYK